jgi:hypothetical protein
MFALKKVSEMVIGVAAIRENVWIKPSFFGCTQLVGGILYFYLRVFAARIYT